MKVRTVAFACAGLAMVSVSAVGEVVSADEALKEIGFKDTSYLYAGTQTVSDKISGGYNIQAGSGWADKQIVTLGRDDNDFTGGTFVKSGTLVVPSFGFSFDPFGALGYAVPMAPIVLGHGTLRFTEDVFTDRDFALYSNVVDPWKEKFKTGTVYVDEGKTVRTTGRIFEVSGNGNLMKRGAGTFVLATRGGAENQIGQSDVIGDNDKVFQWANVESRTEFDDYGNSPTNNKGFSAFTVAGGTFVVDTASTVTNRFGDQVWAGAVPSSDGTENTGRLEINGGVNIMRSIHIGRNHGRGSSDTPLHSVTSTLAQTAGTVEATELQLAYYGKGGVGELDVSGGYFHNSGLTGLYYEDNFGVINVRGTGRVDLDGPLFSSRWTGNANTGCEINLADRGELRLKDGFSANAYDNSIVVNLSDDARLVTERILANKNVDAPSANGKEFTINANGGTLVLTDYTQGNMYYYGDCCYVGEKGLTIDLSEAYRWGPGIQFDILTAPGVEQDGGLVIRGGSVAGHKEQIGARVPIRLMRPIALKGGVRIENARAHFGYDDFSTTVFTVADGAAIGPRVFPGQVAGTTHLKELVFEGDTGTLDVGIISANVANLTIVDALTLPKKNLCVAPCHWRDFGQTWTAGDYAVLKFPASVDLDPTMCRSSSSFVPSDAAYTNRTRFYVEEADGWKTLHLVVSGADKPFGTETIAVNEDLVLSSEYCVMTNDITYNVAEGKTLTFAGRYIANGRISTSGKGRTVFADGADCEFRNGFIFGTTTTNEMNGGTIRFSGKFDRASSSSVIVWNGSTLKPVGGSFAQPFTTGMKSVVLGANGAFLDLSECDAIVFTFGIDFKGPGDMNIVGRNPWTSFGFIRASDYYAGTQNEWTGNLVIGEGGCATFYYNYCAHIPVLVKNGGGFGGWYWSQNTTVQFGEKDTDVTYCFPFQKGNTASAVGTTDTIQSKGAFTIKGKMRVAWRAQNEVDSPNGDATMPRDLYVPVKNGAYRFCQAPKGAFADVSMDQIELMPGVNDRKGARFYVDTSDKTYDYIVAEIFDKKAHVDTATPASGAGTGVHTWMAAGSGDYGTASNWDTAPEAAKSEQIAFPSSLASDIAVSGDRVHLAAVTQSAGREVALDFDETSFTDGATLDIADPSGVLKIAGAIWGDGAIVKTGSSGKGRLVLDGQVKGKPTIEVNSGYLDAKPENLGEATVKPANATVRFTDSGVCKAGFVQPTTQTTGFSVEVEDGKEVVLVGDIDNNNQFSKRGTGTLIVKGLATKNLKLATRSKTTGTRLIPVNGDAPNGEHAAVMEGRMVIDLPSDRQIKVSGAEAYNEGDFVVGFSPSLNAEGTRANDAVLDLVSGTLSTGAFSLGRRQASENTNTLAGLDERPRATVNVRGGTLSTGYLMMGFCSYTYYNCYLSVMNVYDGGTVKVTGSNDNTGRCVIGHDHNNTVTKDGKSDESILNVYTGGLFEHTATTTTEPSGLISIGFYPTRASISAAKPIKGTINVLGGTVRTKVQGGIDLNHANNAANYINNAGYGKIDGTLNLRGGLVEVGNVFRSLTNKTTATFRMDGGVYHPLQAGAALSNLTLVAVGAGGACFKIDEAYSIKTPLSHDPELGAAVDGGLIKIGAGVLTNMVANTFTGPIEVREGTLVMAGDSAPVESLRVDLAGTSGTIEGLSTAAGAALYLDNVPEKLRGTVELPLAATGRARFDLVYVNGQLVPGRIAYVKTGKLVTQGPGTVLILR